MPLIKILGYLTGSKGDESPFLATTSFIGSSESKRFVGLRLMLRLGLGLTLRFLGGLALCFLRGLCPLLGLQDINTNSFRNNEYVLITKILC